LVFIVLFVGAGTISNAQECNCDYTISSTEDEIWLVNKPGSHTHQKYWPLKRKGETVICLEAGLRGRLYIRDFNAGINNDGSKYVFKNCAGLVEIKAPSSDGIVFFNCQDIKLSGAGDPQIDYGIKISETRWTGTNYGNGFGISLQNYSEKTEIEYVEITNTGFSAIVAKTDGGKYYPDGSEFILNDCYFHNNYIHDLLKGEGFYVGHNSWSEDSKQHKLNGIHIYDNVLKNIPWDGIQIGGTKNDTIGEPAHAEVYGNSIINYGTDTNAIDQWQNNGINLSSGFSGKCYNNLIKSGGSTYTYKGNGIITGGVGDVHIFNNIIIEPLEAGVFVAKSTAEKNKSFYIYNNSIIRPKGLGLDYRIPSNLSIGYFINNLVTFGTDIYRTHNGCSLEVKNNFRELINQENLFVDYNQGNYRLKPTALNVIDRGETLSMHPFVLLFDFYKNSRSPNALYDIGAVEY
jgi:hypothetical protein